LHDKFILGYNSTAPYVKAAYPYAKAAYPYAAPLIIPPAMAYYQSYIDNRNVMREQNEEVNELVRKELQSLKVVKTTPEELAKTSQRNKEITVMLDSDSGDYTITLSKDKKIIQSISDYLSKKFSFPNRPKKTFLKLKIFYKKKQIKTDDTCENLNIETFSKFIINGPINSDYNFN
jgi:uncharacterized membrane protein YfhO